MPRIQTAKEIPKLENHVLSRTRLQGVFLTTKRSCIIRCQESYGESELGVLVKLLDDCPTSVSRSCNITGLRSIFSRNRAAVCLASLSRP